VSGHLDAGARDFLSHCEAANAGNPVLERIRERGAEAILAVFRLVKNAFVHAIDNRAVTQTAAQSAEIIAGFAATVGQNVSITFIGDTVFVCGQLLRASRATYEAAVELGKVLSRSDVSEITVDGSVTPEDLLTFAAAVVQGHREPAKRGVLLAGAIPHVGVRKVDAGLEQRRQQDDLPANERILLFYATSVVVMRGFFDSVAEGATLLPHRVKRLSQQLVTVSETSDPALLGLTAMGSASRDDASRVVLSAVLTVVVARRITSERVVLARLAMAALMAEVGKVRLAGSGGRDELLPLSLDTDARVPASTATVCVATGGVNVSNAFRTIVTSEATWLEREAALGPAYGRRLTPLVEAQIVRLSRALVDEMAPRDAAASPKSPLDALARVVELPGMDPALVRLLAAAVGLAPTGSVVEFETGEWAVVSGPSKNPDAFERPVVRLVIDRNGRPLSPPREVDLGSNTSGRVFPRISRVIAPRQARFNVTRVLHAKGT
jgi:hypothetical protein